MNKNEEVVMPSKGFIKRLAELTDENAHTECYRAIAEWGERNAAHTNERVVFHMFWKMFDAMDAAHNWIGHFPFGNMRYEVGKELDGAILKVFGEKVLNAINKGR